MLNSTSRGFRGGDLLEGLARQLGAVQVFRYANLFHYAATFAEMGLDVDDIETTLEFLGGEPTLDTLLDDPFRAKTVIEPRYSAGRYSDGRWPVFYSSLERETARAEWSKHHLDLARGGDKSRLVYFSCFACAFDGTLIDLRPNAGAWSGLTAEEYSICRTIAAEAKSAGVEAFLAPSARVVGGTTVPVFERESLSNPELVKLSAFTVDDQGEVEEHDVSG